MTVDDDLSAQLTAMIDQGEYPAAEVPWLQSNAAGIVAASAASRYGKLLEPTPGAARSEEELRNALRSGIYVLHLHR